MPYVMSKKKIYAIETLKRDADCKATCSKCVKLDSWPILITTDFTLDLI